MYFDDIVDPSTLSDVSMEVSVSGSPVAGTYTVSLSANGNNAIINFSPSGGFPQSTTVDVLLTATDGLLDDGGNTLSSEYSFSFTTGQSIQGDATNLGFESGTTSGWQITGNGGIVPLPYAGLSLGGSNAVAITTGDVTDGSMSGSAVDGRYSGLGSGSLSVPSGTSRVLFDYYFISAEFDEFIGSSYDDTVTLVISGPSGSETVVLESINRYASADTTLVSVGWDSDASYVGQNTADVDISTLGSPVTIDVTITDVGDTAYTSMFLADNFRFE